MRTTLPILGIGLLRAALIIGLGLSQGLAATVTFTNTPTAVSNSYTGTLTLQIGGLTNGETVVVQQFLDADTNGVIDAGDWLVQQFRLTDGVASVVGGVTNLNVPGDSTPTNGAITAQMDFATSGLGVGIAARYLYKLSSPSGRFTPVTNLFTVTNLPYSQSVTGKVVCSGTNIPDALVMAFNGAPMNSSPVGSAIANNVGSYTLPLPPGTYSLLALKTNYVANGATAPTLTLGSGATPATNITLLPATCGISGKVEDAANSNLGLPGIWMFPKSTNSLIAFGFTDTNGLFAIQVTASDWELKPSETQVAALDYVRFQDDPEADTTGGSVTGLAITQTKGTALFYGTVKDGQNHPLPGVKLYPDDDSNVYEGAGTTDQNGNYAVAVVAGSWQIGPDNNDSPGYSNYIFPQVDGVPIADGQAVREDFVGVVATNQIAGYLKDGSNNPIGNVWIWANTTIGGTSYQTGLDTDASGHYAFNVCNGVWSVGVSCGGGGDNLGSQYQCPDSQTVTLANNNTNVNFTALLAPSEIKGTVKDNSNNPIANVSVYAYQPAGGGPGPGTTTDSNGNYSFNVANGSWNVGLNCCGNNGLSPLGYQCVGEQSTSVSDSTSVVNFTAPRAPYQITGHVRDAANNPIANVGVNANVGKGSPSACATTDSNGAYTLYVTNGDWNVNLECGGLGSLGYLCPNGQSVTVSGASAVLDFSTVLAPYTISGWVRNTSNQPFTNVDVYAYATIGTNSYWMDFYTDSNGNFAFPVANGQWGVGVDCDGLGGGYLCPNDVSVTIAGASVVTNFAIPPCGALQVLTTSLPDGQVGSYYDVFVQASSCNPPFTWSLFSGTVPPGLSGDPLTGEIFGTPTTNGTFDFTLQVTDGNDDTANQPLSVTIAAAPADVAEYYVMKVEIFRQIDAANLVADTSHGPFEAKAGIVQSSLGAVPIANMDLPTGVYRAFPPADAGLELVVRDYYTNQASFDAVYTNGDYTFALATLDNGFLFPVLTMPVAVYPTNPPPRLSNFAAAQAVNPANPFTLQWTNPSEATTNDTIWVWINDASGNMVFSTPEPSMSYPTCLKGTATSVAVPANTLQPGVAYTGFIGFFRINGLNLSGYAGALGVTLAGVITDFPLAAPSSRPVLSQPARISATQFGFLLSGAANQNYTVLATTNPALRLSNWSTVLTTNFSGSAIFIQDNQAAGPQRFYRVKVGP